MAFPRRNSKQGSSQLKYKTDKRKPEIDGHVFDSKLEAHFYLWMRERPEIEILEIHPRFTLQEAYQKKDGKKIKQIEYIADFRIDVQGDYYIVDAKGQETADFKLKRKIFEKRYPDYMLLVMKTEKQLEAVLF